MAEVMTVDYQKSQDDLCFILGLCRDELTVRELRLNTNNWQAVVALMTLEDTIKTWRKNALK